jgi:hypothetical protein
MIARTLMLLGTALVAGGVLSAQPKQLLQYNPVSCVKAGELPLLQISVDGKGELRSYFRRINTSDWCSVDGVNDGALSRVVLPKFEAGDEIEYFFVLLDGRRVLARSPRIYRTRVAEECEVPFARHVVTLSLACGEDVQALPAAMGAAYAVSDGLVGDDPEYQSPDRPLPQRRP